MKNMEKYPNTKDALEAYAAYKGDSIGGVPFERWLELEYAEPREPTLLEAAEVICNILYSIRMTEGSSTNLASSEVCEKSVIASGWFPCPAGRRS